MAVKIEQKFLPDGSYTVTDYIRAKTYGPFPKEYPLAKAILVEMWDDREATESKSAS